MIRIDMSEYQERHTVARLIGAPPGYVGYEEGGQLTEAVRRRPYSVILFDEVEKAHPEVFNVLLQVLDDGRLTDGQGRTVDFRNTVIIMTSNLGSQYIQELVHDEERMREAVMDVLRQHFRPEFLNRLDEVIIFRPLTKADLKQIVDIQIKRLVRLLEDRRMQIRLTERAKERLAEEGYDPVYGARPLKRVIQRRIQDKLAMEILEGRFMEGDIIEVDYDDELNEFVFRKIGNVHVDKNDIKRLTDLVGRKLNDLLVVGVRNASYNGRDIVMEPDLPITKGLQESLRQFRELEEEIELQPILDHLATYPPLERELSEDVVNMLPDLVGTLILVAARLMKTIEPRVVNPDTEMWERVEQAMDLTL